MGKKGKGKKEKKPKPEGPDPVELQNQLTLMEKEKLRESEYRNYMQLERDKINAFWEITRTELEDRKAELRNKDREMEEMEERHEIELKVYKQKVKHLLFEHQSNITTLKADGEAALTAMNDGAIEREGVLTMDKRALKQDLKEMELAHEDMVRHLRLNHAKEISKIRKEFEDNARALQVKYEKKQRNLRDEQDLRRKQEVHEIEERKNAHINELMRRHEKAFAEIKNYYNDITHNNLDLIKTLKDDVAEMKKKESANEKLMYEIAQENKRLAEPLTRALKEVETLRHQLADHDKDKASLAQTRARFAESERKLKNLEWEHEVMEQRFAQVEAERDDLYNKFETAIYDVQQKTGLRNLLLEKKIKALDAHLEKKEAQLSEVLRAANLDPSTLSSVTRRLEDVLDAKNSVIGNLSDSLDKVTKAHNDLIRTYEAKLAQFGIPADELGFRPLVTKTSTMPAGLVAAN